MRLAVALGCLLLYTTPLCAGEAFFTERVRPILAGHCFKCHGPDEQARKAKLRLDQREAALRPARSGKPALVPGKPDDSELIRRVFASDADELMPPPHAKLPLSEDQKRDLRRWVQEGAPYATHWAFVPPRQSEIRNPKSENRHWPRNAIDRFVLERLEREGLKPSPEADRYTLVRRASLDLIGLPPTVEEADAFVRDESPDAYDKLIDRLLASPHYGERWARPWLDLARYADTNGYEKDRPRSIWPYRDWVIDALNADMPFDRFTVEQLAGDLLPNATPAQRVATGFHRNTMLNEEGGIDPLEFRYYAVVDRVNTTGTAWLGLTFGCAQCHTHKFDPIPHKEYYQTLAFLNNADERDFAVPRPELVRRRRELEAKIAALTAELPRRLTPEQLKGAFAEWQARHAEGSVPWTVLRPAEAKANLPRLTVLPDQSVLASGDQSKRDVYDLTLTGDFQGVTALRLEVLPDDSLPNRGPGRTSYEGPIGDFFLSEVTVTADGRPAPLRQASQSFAAGKNTAAAAIDGDPQTGWTINGGQGKPHWAVFRFAEPLPAAGTLHVRLLCERYHAAGLGRFRLAATRAPQPAARDLPVEVDDILLVPAAQRTPEQQQRLLAYYASVAPELAKDREPIEKLKKQLPALPTTLVFTERPPDQPRPTFVHYRGEFLQPGEAVEPAVLSVLPPLPPGSPRNRLSFARWLVSPDNPLVGRVTMNRQWAAFFGRGLVRTLQDFGYQGEPPTHPELLDWLALEFIRQGWSLKTMHRLIVTSATYRQASRVSPELLARDPDNKLLARGPRVRLEAELIRDAALAAGGLLSEKLGGPSVFPPQPPGVTTEGTYGRLDWKVSAGPDRYRRGLYTFTKRTAPYAMATTFDAPSGEVCVARREVSNTPLQALTLLNDPVFVEAAQALGRRLAERPGSVEARAAFLFRRGLTRPPADDELAALVKFVRAQKERLERKELNSVKLAGSAEGDVIERAAWTLAARALLNLDETITKE